MNIYIWSNTIKSGNFLRKYKEKIIKEKEKKTIDRMVKFYIKRKILQVKNNFINHVSKHERRYNKTVKTSLNFKSPN